VLCDRDGLPLHALVTGANAHDSTMLAPLLVLRVVSLLTVDGAGQ
jgi:hypothetical protein